MMGLGGGDEDGDIKPTGSHLNVLVISPECQG